MKQKSELAIMSKFNNFSLLFMILDEEDFTNVWYHRISIEIEAKTMWLDKWSPDFKPHQDSSREDTRLQVFLVKFLKGQKYLSTNLKNAYFRELQYITCAHLKPETLCTAYRYTRNQL